MIGDLVAPTPVTLPDGTVVLIDDLGRVVVPEPPSPWDIFWRDPVGEVRDATGVVVAGASEAAGAAAGGVAAGLGTGVAAGVSSGLERGLGQFGGSLVLIGALVLVGVIVLGKR